MSDKVAPIAAACARGAVQLARAWARPFTPFWGQPRLRVVSKRTLMHLLHTFAVATTAAVAISIGLSSSVAESAVQGSAAGITPTTLDAVGIGATAAQVRKLWGQPTQIQRARLRSGEYAFVYTNATVFNPAGNVIF